MKYMKKERERDLHVKVLDGLLSIHHFARKWELRAAARVVNVHWHIHHDVGAPKIENGQNSKDEGEGGH